MKAMSQRKRLTIGEPLLSTLTHGKNHSKTIKMTPYLMIILKMVPYRRIFMMTPTSRK